MWEGGPSYHHQELLDAGCTDRGTALPRYCCPAESFASCVNTRACGNVTTQAECDARDDCHSVFLDPNTCGCAEVGCCARFSRCADGGHAQCDAPIVTCDMVTPYCEDPAYVLSYTGQCYEGCVKPDDCG
jgi:hypothetical protein